MNYIINLIATDVIPEINEKRRNETYFSYISTIFGFSLITAIILGVVGIGVKFLIGVIPFFYNILAIIVIGIIVAVLTIHYENSSFVTYLGIGLIGGLGYAVTLLIISIPVYLTEYLVISKFEQNGIIIGILVYLIIITIIAMIAYFLWADVDFEYSRI